MKIRDEINGTHRAATIWMGLIVSLFVVVGCGAVSNPLSSGVSKPPQISVTVGNQQIQAASNGYQWASGNHGTVADAASVPAKNLHPYAASVGEQVKLSFSNKPTSTDVAMWSNGKQVSTTSLTGDSFSLPTKPGDYTYEITGHWRNNYAAYDFEVQVK